MGKSNRTTFTSNILKCKGFHDSIELKRVKREHTRMYRPVGSTSAYSASTTSSPPPNTSILDQPRAKESTSKHHERERGSGEKWTSEMAGEGGVRLAPATPWAQLARRGRTSRPA